MRLQPPVIRYVVLLLALVFATGTVSADSRSEARTHYQAGVKFYGTGDYKSAIREFSAAQQLAPADLNNYNLALCYDKLGDPEPAIQYYRAFLDKQAGSDKKAEIEASIARLESASKSVAAKRADEARRADEAKKAADAKAAADAAKRAELEAKAAAEAAKKATAAKPPEDAKKPIDDGGAGVGVDASAGVGVGSTGTPGAGTTVSTGDAQLDRISGLDINQIRDQRMGNASSGIRDTRGGQATSANVGAGAASPNPADPSTAAAPAPTGQPANGGLPSDKPKATPVYKKWWFWVVVGVGLIVVYSIATEDQRSTNQAREQMFGSRMDAATQPGGVTLLRW